MLSCGISLPTLFPISVEFDPILGIEFIQCSGSILNDNQRYDISHQAAEEISKRAATVAARQIKDRPEKFCRKTNKVFEDSLKIQNPRQSFRKSSCISNYRTAGRLTD
jgi:hypothetical protein